MVTSFRHICASLVLAAAASTTSIALNSSLTAPLELTHGKPFVMVMVNGKGPFRFVIDTGTGAEAFVSGELADELNLQITGQVHLSDPSKQGGKRVPTVLLRTLEVAGVVFTDVKAVRHELSSADGNCDGLLGFELFRDYLLTLDYPNRRMTLTSGSLAPDGERSVLPFRMPDGIPVIPLRVGDLEINAQIDSGGTGLSLPEDLVSKLKFTSDPEVFGVAESLSTRFELKAAKLASDVHLGGYTFTRPFVEIQSAFPLANLGTCAMQEFAFTFDQKNGLVRFESSRLTRSLAATPTPMRMQNTPVDRVPAIALVPIG